MPDRSLAAGARAALRCLGVTREDAVLVLCNPRQRTMAEALAAAAGRSVTIAEFPELSRHGEEPPAAVTDAVAGATALFALTTYSLSHTRLRHDATDRGVRIASMPGVTEEIFARALVTDYGQLKRTGDVIAAALTAAETCRITSAAGTDVTLALAGRTGICDDGNLQQPGAWGNLPAGEAFIAPLETRGDGTIVFDGALAGYGALARPLRVTLAGGRVVDAVGDAAGWLLSTLDDGGPGGRLIAEVGIGTNPEAQLTGDICEDEKVAETAHLAFGTSASIGGVNVAAVHIDGVLLAPTVELDGTPLLRNGKRELP